MSEAPFATVLVPTHNHSHLIGYALRSIQAQAFSDFELFVVGDGAPPATREVVASLARSDPRIRYFDMPKGERHGEENRHVALQEARGRIVAYCGDDDLWMREHLTTICRLLRTADFVNTLQVEIYLNGVFNVRLGNLADPETRKRMLENNFGFFGLTESAHSMAAYRQLSDGWTPAPVGGPSDQYMFRKFVALPGIRYGSGAKASAIHLPSPLRTEWSNEERILELSRFFDRLNAREFRAELNAAIEKKQLAGTKGPSRLLMQAKFACRKAVNRFGL